MRLETEDVKRDFAQLKFNLPMIHTCPCLRGLLMPPAVMMPGNKKAAFFKPPLSFIVLEVYYEESCSLLMVKV